MATMQMQRSQVQVSRSRQRTASVVAAASVVSTRSLWVFGMVALLGKFSRAGCKLAYSDDSVQQQTALMAGLSACDLLAGWFDKL
jgi:hypothetical protein